MKAILKHLAITLLISTAALNCMDSNPTNKKAKKEINKKKCDMCYKNKDTIRPMPNICMNPINYKFICKECYNIIKAESKNCPYCRKKKFFSLFKRKK